MPETRQNFVIENPGSDISKKYRYYVSYIVFRKYSPFRSDQESYHTSDVLVAIEILYLEDIAMVAKHLLAYEKKKKPHTEKVIILGLYRVYD